MEKTETDLPHNKGEKKRVYSYKFKLVTNKRHAFLEIKNQPVHMDYIRDCMLPEWKRYCKQIKNSICLHG